MVCDSDTGYQGLGDGSGLVMGQVRGFCRPLAGSVMARSDPVRLAVT
jgi:hypothetical protein